MNTSSLAELKCRTFTEPFAIAYEQIRADIGDLGASTR
jgi:hypothetical protein